MEWNSFENTYSEILYCQKLSRFTKTANFLHFGGIKFRGSCIRAREFNFAVE